MIDPSAPRVSIVMPAFNTAAYVARAIQSARAQSFADFELLVVDDGSTDETRAIAERFVAQDPRVRVWSQPNRGACRARNQAFAHARGEYIALLDSDDCWMPEYLETEVRILDTHPDVAAVTANAVNMGGRLDGTPYWPTGEGLREISLLDMIEREDSVSIMCVFRRAIVDTIGGIDETFVDGSEDYEFWLRAALEGFTFARQQRPLAYYRRRADSASASELKMLRGISAALGKIASECARRGMQAEHDAACRQRERFEGERLRVEGRSALRSGDFHAAAERFEQLHRRSGGARVALVAAWLRYAPASLRWVDGLRRSVLIPLRTRR